ncbi:MAG TPA: Uma2 family endonuclease, partial [Longimicrobiales bacterium]|nr:Uma2 family endonuclease [Longimicrobiales bacterium]
ARLPPSGTTRYEVIDDELVVTPGTTARHQRIVRELMYRLVGFTKEQGLGEVFSAPFDVLFAEGDYVEPDLLFVRSDRLHLVSDRGVEGPPDLVVEVVSPSTAARDRGAKLDRYRLFGVAEYWVVDPDGQTVEVWDLAGGASEPVVYGVADTLRWESVSDGPTLEVAIENVFAG